MINNFLVLGHRGSSLLWQENTLEAFESALKARADGFELDVMVTADGVPVLFHDPDLKRLHSLPLRIEEVTYGELVKALQGKQNVCTLRKALELASDWSAWVDVEIKTTKWQVVAEELRAFDPRRIIVSSFRHDVIHEWKRAEGSRYTYAYIYQHFPKDLAAYLSEVDLVKPEISFLDDRYLLAPQRVLPWAVNSRDLAEILKKLGYFGIITDFPQLMADEGQISQELGYLLACIEKVEQNSSGFTLVLKNRLAPVYVREIVTDVQTELSERLPFLWEPGHTLAIELKGLPSSITIDTNYTGKTTLPFAQLLKFLHKQV